MNEILVKRLCMIGGIVLFFVCLALVIIGQKNISYGGLAQMMVGLAGLLIILAVYNIRTRG